MSPTTIGRSSWPGLHGAPTTVRLALAVRACALVVLCAGALLTDGRAAVPGLLAVATAWVLAAAAEQWGRGPWAASVVLEAVAVGTACGLVVHHTTAVLGALAVGPLTAGLRRGAEGASLALLTEVGAVSTVGALAGHLLDDGHTEDLVTWSVVAVGFAMIAAFLHAALTRDPDPLAPYHDAQDLIRQLLELSEGLGSGIDPAALAAGIVESVRDELPVTAAAVYVPRGDQLTPLAIHVVGPSADLGRAESLALVAHSRGRSMVAGHTYAFPLVAGATTAGIVAGQLPGGLDVGGVGLADRVRQLTARLAPEAVRLDTALLFETLRDRATTVERRRLAREIHDGLGQDIASLGYLVDALAAQPGPEAQARALELLRERITAIVAEVRRSVVTLRSGVADSPSLGAALATVARNLSESSGIHVNVTADERETRLRPEIEAELFRIAQEAITNAVRHAGAGSIEVQCQVRPPQARITISDDGAGLRPARPDSQGMDIMRERASLIGARLDIEHCRPHGTSVTVQLPAGPSVVRPLPIHRQESASA